MLAPGSWVKVPSNQAMATLICRGHQKSLADLRKAKLGNFYYVGGTLQATPHVASVAALMLEKNPTLNAAGVENIPKTTALVMPSSGTRHVYDNTLWTDMSWDTDCDGNLCDAVGAGLMQADQALANTPQ